MNLKHVPVLLKEAIEFLNVRKGGKYVDATFGGGGHGVQILEHGGAVLGIDWDPESIENLKLKIKNLPGLRVVNGNFSDIEQIAKSNGFFPADGVLFDLGISSIQLAPIKSGLEESGRGFSFGKDEPLDMRMSPLTQGLTAADLVNSLREDQLYELFSETNERGVARVVARAIVKQRVVKKIERTGELAGLVDSVYRGRERKISPATTIFLALRMAVNSELENLEAGLAGAFEILAPRGRLVVISFHSGEDRIVKNFIRVKSDPSTTLSTGSLRASENRMINLTDRPIMPSGEEIFGNPRARSAKLRAGEKIC